MVHASNNRNRKPRLVGLSCWFGALPEAWLAKRHMKLRPMSANELTTLRIGEEYDPALLSRLRAAVAGLGGFMTEPFWGVGGSQEITKYKISLPDGAIEAEAETYIGLSLRGPEQLVQQVALAVQRA